MENRTTEMIAGEAKAASLSVARLSTEEKNNVLLSIAVALTENSAKIIKANCEDVEKAKQKGTGPHLIDRLSLDEKRIAGIAEGVRQVASLPDPVGKTEKSWTRPNGLKISKVRVPIGVIGMVYEARPNVTVDAAVLAFKAGSASVLRGSYSADRSNHVLVEIMQDVLEKYGIPRSAISLLSAESHDSVNEMMALRGKIDLIIPRGGASLINNVVMNSKVPVLETGVGNCHVYIHEDADPEMAERITVNAKVQRPTVCNAAETLLVHSSRKDILIRVCNALMDKGVTIHGSPEVCGIIPQAVPVTEKDYAEEFLSLDMAVKTVDSIDEAVGHIAEYGTGHTEAIITESSEAAEFFKSTVDAACVNINASTRFTDGFEFGFGAEIGISTQKIHARGPVGLEEITSYKYIVEGNGQVRG